MYLNKPSWPHSGAKILFNYRHRKRLRRLIKMHIKEYLNLSPLCKWSMVISLITIHCDVYLLCMWDILTVRIVFVCINDNWTSWHDQSFAELRLVRGRVWIRRVSRYIPHQAQSKLLFRNHSLHILCIYYIWQENVQAE